MELSYILIVVAAFLAAGAIKGAVGMGLPPTAVALATLALPLQEVLVLVTVPVLVTNFWQAFWGGHLLALLRRFWSMALCIMAGCIVSAFAIQQLGSPFANGLLGVVLALFAIIALLAWQPRVPRRVEWWTNPLFGTATGLVGGVTGVAAVPFLPYMQSLELDRNELVQALGILFICFTLAISVALADTGALTVKSAGAAVLATIPTLIGLWIGQQLRRVISAAAFRKVFLVVMLGLGLNMARSLL